MTHPSGMFFGLCGQCGAMLGCALMVAETFSDRGSAVLNGLRFDGLCLMVALGLGNVAVSDGQCLMAAETLGEW